MKTRRDYNVAMTTLIEAQQRILDLLMRARLEQKDAKFYGNYEKLAYWSRYEDGVQAAISRIGELERGVQAYWEELEKGDGDEQSGSDQTDNSETRGN
jgi:hypothetical protein